LSDECIHLFSSNSRTLYAQDIINVVARPVRDIYRFRYDVNWLSPDLQPQWSRDLADRPVFVHFALQDESQYFDPVFVPVRRGRAVSILSEGEFRFIDFELDDFLLLPEVSRQATSRQLGDNVRAFTKSLTNVVQTPHAAYASLGPDIVANKLVTASHDVSGFRTVSAYLGASPTFRSTCFLFCSGFREREGGGGDGSANDTIRVPRAVDGSFELSDGRSYELDVLYFCPGQIDSALVLPVRTLGSGVTVTSPFEIRVAARFDTVRVTIQAGLSNPKSTSRSRLVIEPSGSELASNLDLALRTSPNKAATAMTVGASVIPLVGVGITSYASGLVAALAVVGLAVLTIWAALKGYYSPVAGAWKLPSLGDGTTKPGEPGRSGDQRQ
jgi:hypothetical protein